MPLFTSPDGRYTFAMETAGSGLDGNSVVYDRDAPGGVPPLGKAVWSRKHYEAELGEHVPTPPAPPVVRPPTVPAPAPGPLQSGGGIFEAATATTVRPRLTRAQIAAFMPAIGSFRFPDPYGTRGIRLTNASDGTLHPLGMSYWPNINQHAGLPELRVLLSVNQTLAVLTIDKATGRRVDSQWLPFGGTGEGVYWSLTDTDALYVPQMSGLLRFNVKSHSIEAVVSVTGATTQFHSSADGRTHSMTIDGQPAAWYANDLHRFKTPNYDECQIDKSGRYLLIKAAGDNRVIDLRTGREWTITNAQGAVGHSDMGYSYVIGEEDQTNPGGVFRLWLYTEDGPVDGGVMYSTDWTGMSRYVSHCNAAPGSRGSQRVLFSGSHAGDAVRANELVVARLDGSLRCRTIAPNLNDLDADDPYGSDNKYWRKTRANICPVGEYACVTGNLGTERVDAFLVEVA